MSYIASVCDPERAHVLGQDEVFGSGYAAAVYLSRVVKFPKDKRVYVIGEAGLEEELDSVGIAHAGGTVSLLDLLLLATLSFEQIN